MLNAQIDLFGYAETEVDQIHLTEAAYNFGYGKIRIDGEYRPWEGLLLAGNVNGQKYFGKTEWDFLIFYHTILSKRITAQCIQCRFLFRIRFI